MSGSGKTKMMDYVLEYLTFVASEDKKMGDLIQRVNKLLDSFGNCATSRNTNASRIVKNVEISFNANAEIVGATFTSCKISRYLVSLKY